MAIDNSTINPNILSPKEQVDKEMVRSYSHTRQISGPINVMRLEGNIAGIKKVIYLFMDYHLPVEEQTQCNNIFSPDVQKYFADSFYNLSHDNRMYDFFLEIYPTRLTEYKSRHNHSEAEYKERYIDEVMKFFRKIFNYDKKNNKVLVNKMFKNIRLHYLDIRAYYKHGIQQQLFQLLNIIKKIHTLDDITTNIVKDIINIITSIKEQMQNINNILSKKPNKLSTSKIIKLQTRKLDIEAIEYLTNKIKISYHNKNVQATMIKLLNQSIINFQNTINDMKELIEEFNNYIQKMELFENKTVKNDKHNMIINIVNKVNDLIENKIIEFFARFTDIYFLRRFLDKKYITNAIVYSGAYHSSTYIYVLVNEFNFKVTHYSYSKIQNIDKLNAEIQKRSEIEIDNIIIPPNNNQCSDMTDFPNDFL